MKRFYHFLRSIVAIAYGAIASGLPLQSAFCYDNFYDFDTHLDLGKLNELEIYSGSINSSKAQEQPYVIIVSLDGFRYDYPTLHNAPNLKHMMENGSYVRRLIPSFPSKTFPNHYTIATGLYPSNHGIINNTFYSRERNEKYHIQNKEAVGDGSWYNGTPLWVLAEQQHMCSASFFWVGSEANIAGTRPSRYFHYHAKVPYDLRVKKVQQWIELPKETRPHLILLYYSLTDSAGHAYGPEAPETAKAVNYVDQCVGQIRDVIASSDLPINLIVTADHGMTEVNQTIHINDCVDIGSSRFIPGPMAMIYTDSEPETQRIYSALQNQDDFDCYLRASVPTYLHFKNEDRIGDIVLIAHPPKEIGNRTDTTEDSYAKKGTHGYDPYRFEDMGAIFIAEGPNIVPGRILPPIENIHIYPFIAALLNLEITSPIDGNPHVLAPLLKQ